MMSTLRDGKEERQVTDAHDNLLFLGLEEIITLVLNATVSTIYYVN